MGYHTQFRVELRPLTDQELDGHTSLLPLQAPRADYIEALHAALGEEIFDRDGWSSSELKWYQWEEDMIAASAKLPGVLITLTGLGEDGGDIWKAYFLDGMAQSERPLLVFPVFDRTKLAGRPHMPRRTSIWG
jgi:hypothetical protein